VFQKNGMRVETRHRSDIGAAAPSVHSGRILRQSVSLIPFRFSIRTV
jgi:hypothetical protein